MGPTSDLIRGPPAGVCPPPPCFQGTGSYLTGDSTSVPYPIERTLQNILCCQGDPESHDVVEVTREGTFREMTRKIPSDVTVT